MKERENPWTCSVYSTGVHERWRPVICSRCYGGAAKCAGCGQLFHPIKDCEKE